jgi:drug/metabolite transporter (DMT)-like permease
LRVIGIVQLVFGLLFTLAPAALPTLLDLQPAQPSWVNWLLAMTGARFLGYGIGMFAAARDPQRHQAWIATMILVQAIDWIATVVYLVAGVVMLRNVTTAAFLPGVFIAMLVIQHPRRRGADDSEPSLLKNASRSTNGSGQG